MTRENQQCPSDPIARDRQGGAAITAAALAGLLFAAAGCSPQFSPAASAGKTDARASASAASTSGTSVSVGDSEQVPATATRSSSAAADVPVRWQDLRFFAVHSVAIKAGGMLDVVAGGVGEFTIHGPIVDTLQSPAKSYVSRVVALPDAAGYMGTGHDIGRFDAGTREWTELEEESVGRTPRLGIIRGLAYDSKRQRLVACSHADDQYHLCFYCPESRRWLSRKSVSLKVKGLVYSPDEDVIYALEIPDLHVEQRNFKPPAAGEQPSPEIEPFRIHKLDADGELISTVEGEQPIAIMHVSGRASFSGFQHVQMAYANGYLVALMPRHLDYGVPDPDNERVAPARIHVIDPKTGKVVFSGPSRPRSKDGILLDFCRPRSAPTVPEAARLACLERRIDELRTRGLTDRANSYANRLHRLRRKKTGHERSTPADRPERHLVAFRQDQHQEGSPPAEAVVYVEDVGAPVTLLLSSQEQVRWRVELQETAELDKVVLCGFARQKEPVAGLPEAAQVVDLSRQANPDQFVYVSSAHPATRRACARAWLGGTLLTRQSMHRDDGKPLVVGPSNPDWHTQHLASLARELENELMVEDLRSVRFPAIHRTRDGDEARSFLAQFTVDGPVPEGRTALSEPVEQLAVDTRGPTHYGSLGAEVYRLNAATGRATRITGDQTIPASFRGTGLTLDTKRCRLLFQGTSEGRATNGGVNVWGRFTHSYDPDARIWRAGFDCTCDLGGITYVSQEDMLYGLVQPLHDGYISALCKRNPQGAVIDAVPLSELLLWSVKNGSPQLISVRDKFVAITPPRQTWPPDGGQFQSMIFVIDPRNGQTVFVRSFPAN